MTRQRVVVTGLGVLAANGSGAAAFGRALEEGRSGVRPVTRFDVSDFAYGQAAQIEDGLLDAPGPLDRASRMAVMAAEQAWSDAGAEGAFDRARVGVCVGTTMGGVLSLEALQRAAGCAPSPAPEAGLWDELRFDAMARNAARALRLRGPRSTITIACASGAQAIGYAADLVRRGAVEAMLAGGVDALSPFVFYGFHAVRAVTRGRNRPFDRSRDGLVLGEGAGLVLLETAASAARRGARVYAEVAGCGFSNDGVHPTAPDPRGGGLLRSIRAALAQAGVAPEEIDYVCAHGTGTVLNDRMELRAIESALGAGGRRIPVTSIKPMIGHTLGAAGAIESVATLLSLKEGWIPPTLHVEDPEPSETALVVRGCALRKPLRVALKLSAGFSGNNAALVFRRSGEA